VTAGADFTPAVCYQLCSFAEDQTKGTPHITHIYGFKIGVEYQDSFNQIASNTTIIA
jgi:hypothetical protein